MAASTPPKTPTARKAAAQPVITTPRATASTLPVSNLQQRRIDGKLIIPLQGLTRPHFPAGGSPIPIDHMRPPKRQRGDTYEKQGQQQQKQQHIVMPASPPNRNPMFVPANISSPQMRGQVPQLPQAAAMTTSKYVFLTAWQKSPSFNSVRPDMIVLTSKRIDTLTHAMWDVAFEQELLMKDFTMKAAMLPSSKLRALARLNYLPSWWFLRTKACEIIAEAKWPIDDTEMQTLWNETLNWAKKVENKFGMQGDTVTIKPENREEAAKSEKGMKMDK